MILGIDFETASECDLIREGAYRYATDPSTEVLMMCYAFGDEPVERWTPLKDEPFPAKVLAHVANGGLIRAFNAEFERLIWECVLCNDFDIPNVPITQWRCTAIQARASGCPAAMKDVVNFLGLPKQKHTEGTRLINEFSKKYDKRFKGSLRDHPEDLETFLDYCADDVEIERVIAKCVRDLSDEEWEDYFVTCELNDRGIPIDRAVVKEAMSYGQELKDGANDKISEITNGAVASSTLRKVRDVWLTEHLTPEALASITVNDKIVFDKDKRATLAARDDLSDTVREFVVQVEEAGGATLSKYKAFADFDLEGNVHGAILLNGAGQTGRFSSKGVQLHNMRRDAFDNPDEVIADLLEGYELDNPADTLGKLIRSVVYNPKGLTWWDWSSIELVVLAWLANSKGAMRRVNDYRNGVDQYVVTAADMFEIAREDVDKGLRQSGKVMELAGGFGGGKGAVMAFAKVYGLDVDEDGAQELVDKWRRANPWAVTMWNEVENAARKAVRRPGQSCYAARCEYIYDGHSWLYCKLPSGRYISYYKPEFQERPVPWGGTALQLTYLPGSKKPKAGAKWPRYSLNRTVLVENITQATAACLLRHALRACSNVKLPVILHVHDEIVCLGNVEEQLGKIMLTPPAWAKDLPLRGEGQTATRYGK